MVIWVHRLRNTGGLGFITPDFIVVANPESIVSSLDHAVMHGILEGQTEGPTTRIMPTLGKVRRNFMETWGQILRCKGVLSRHEVDLTR